MSAREAVVITTDPQGAKKEFRTMKPRYLFDSHALLAFFQNEQGSEVVARTMRRALKKVRDLIHIKWIR